ncbi:Protein-disulfide isomerase [Fulvimarina manganoxydans]|uniref:Protein-disulfide isomerase n=1 Tax=Fulvimarina manganoxydans TaxID=937218 RepID=A0A1W2BZA7_9HYPH|nr:DsbA family protein [Fulvimarina manganoxydans]MCK5931683.1 DsbA family protein [Fulvimarina manganoxydans]SMC77818.1 Protein-disulfide isomerase [Fulvimarina manganoxydans]
MQPPREIAGLVPGVFLLAILGCSAVGSTSAAAQPATEAETAQTATSAAGVATGVEAPESSGSADVAELMAEGPLPDIVIGDPNAPVTIVEYASMTCGHCANFHENSYPAIKADYIDTGKAKLIIREFPFDPRALAAFMLARCTQDDARRTAMIDVLFQQQDKWARAENASTALLNIAKLAGFTQESFAACLNDKELQQKIVETQERGQQEFGVDATPTFFVNGDKHAGALSPEQMAAVIEQKLE